MRYSSSLHNFRHLVKGLLGRAENLLTGIPHAKDDLLVLNYHGTPAKFMDNFRRQLDYFQEKYALIDPAGMEKYFAGTLQAEKTKLLLTFDDGVKNNLLGADFLRERNIRAFFFVVPAFIDTPAARQKGFFTRNIRPVINPSIDSNEEDLTAMSWEDLKRLQQEGHAAGSHTMTHVLTASEKIEAHNTNEIAGSAACIAGKLGKPVTAFCSPNDTLTSTGPAEMRLIRENYSYHFTTYPGSNAERAPYFIRRVNVESSWMMGAVLRATGLWDRKRWEEKRERLNAIIAASR